MIDVNNGGRLRVQKLSEIVAASIRRQIITGVLKSDDNLPSEGLLLEQYQVSRPTLREALRILEAEGLIEISRGIRSGARICPPSDNSTARVVGLALQFRNANVGDVYKVRMVLEPIAARMAAEIHPVEAGKALREQFDVVSALAEEATVNNRFGAIQHEVMLFHGLVVNWSDNATMQVISTALQKLTEHHQDLAYKMRPIKTLEEREKQVKIWLKSLKKLVGFIENGQADEAEAHWKVHMHKAGEEWFDKVGQTLVIDII